MCNCLESYCNVVNLFDEIRDSTTARKFARDGRTIKELNEGEILIDDRPHNILPFSHAIPVTPYYCKVSASRYINYFDVDDDDIENIKHVIDRDAKKFDSNIEFEEASRDDELNKIISKLKQMF